jgi:hypothetical protein
MTDEDMMAKQITVLFVLILISASSLSQVVGSGNGAIFGNLKFWTPILEWGNDQDGNPVSTKVKRITCNQFIVECKRQLATHYSSKENNSHKIQITDDSLIDFLSFGLLLELVQTKGYLDSYNQSRCNKVDSDIKESKSPLLIIAQNLTHIKNLKCIDYIETKINFGSNEIDQYIERLILLEKLNEL